MVCNIPLLRLFRGEEILSAIMLGCVEENQIGIGACVIHGIVGKSYSIGKRTNCDKFKDFLLRSFYRGRRKRNCADKCSRRFFKMQEFVLIYFILISYWHISISSYDICSCWQPAF